MWELVIISGKGGTGKTSIAASFAVLAGRVVLADCDVDAADLHLVLSPQIKHRNVFRSGHEAVIRQADCVACGDCERVCRFDAVRRLDSGEESTFRSERVGSGSSLRRVAAPWSMPGSVLPPRTPAGS
jgi:MinD superfamily P-loop ATPase